jgi:hypothetical protein
LPWTTQPSGDITSKASSAANLITVRSLFVTSRKERVVEWVNNPILISGVAKGKLVEVQCEGLEALLLI